MILTVYLLTWFNTDLGCDIFYVGASGVPDKRKQQHLEAMERGQHPNHKVQYAYHHYGKPSWSILETIEASSPQEAAEAETKWITAYNQNAPYCLCNVAMQADPKGFEVYFQEGMKTT